MFNFIKNKFLFIILISVVTLGLLIVGAFTLYNDNSLLFDKDGYVINSSTSSKSSAKYYFSANTKYKTNVDDKITFKDKDSNDSVVDPASFVHYSDGSIGYLKRGALVNLDEINSSMFTYYNVTQDNIIDYVNGKYSFSINNNDVSVDSFIGRISDDKYIVAGNDVSIQIPDNKEQIDGNYFEILFMKKGIVKIDNEDNSYQVTAEGSYIYVGDKIIINLGNGKIYYNNDAKMLMSQITINGDENIDLDVKDSDKSTNGADGDGTGTDSSDNNLGEDNNSDVSNENAGNEDGDSQENANNSGNNKEGNVSNVNTTDPKIELISVDVSTVSIDADLQINNANAIKGKLVAYFTNVSNGTKVTIDVPSTNGTFNIKQNALFPNTEYNLSVVEIGGDKEKQYLQKTFKTNDLGISLEKEYATDSTLAYRMVFEDNSEVTAVSVSIYSNDGKPLNAEDSEKIISNNDSDAYFEFKNLQSNSNYSVIVDTIWINDVAYSGIYDINRIDSTLKKTPEVGKIKISSNSEEIKFDIKIEEVNDPDKSIISYTYNIYEYDSTGSLDDGDDVKPVYSVVKNDIDPITLNLNEIDELKTGVGYRCRIVLQYNDNEMVREVISEYSDGFSITSRPKIEWKQVGATMNKVMGNITLIDAGCTIPISGRKCLNASNKITLRYYKLGDDETNVNDRIINFNSSTLDSYVEFSGLLSDTTYVVKILGNYYYDGVLYENKQIGDSFYITTDESENVRLKIIGDNKSGHNKDGTENSSNVVTFDAKLTEPSENSEDEEKIKISEEVASIKMNLYAGSYVDSKKLIGTYTTINKDEIMSFFDGITITNNIFTDVSVDSSNKKNNLGKLDTLYKMIIATNNSTKTLNSSYTVEISEVKDSFNNKINVENNVYTFKLTSAYFLDTRIDTNSGKYIEVDKILKEDLDNKNYDVDDITDSERASCMNVNNYDDLNNDTVVGIVVRNNLSDEFVNSAFIYEKATVNYIVSNGTQVVKTVSTDMQNHYNQSSKFICLDSVDKDNGKNFTRGYKYTVKYTIDFITENGENPTYPDKDKENTTSASNVLSTVSTISRQSPIYNQYISKSTSDSITYRYKISDVDKAIKDDNLYYLIKSISDTDESLDDSSELKSAGSLEIDNDNYSDITVPAVKGENSIYLKENLDGSVKDVDISDYVFDGEYGYDNNDKLFSIVSNDINSDNTLKLKILNNDITNRAVVYKVTVKCIDSDCKDSSGNDLGDYIRYFLASKLESDEDGEYKYISLDYARISKYMKKKLDVELECYYDSGMVGINNDLSDGLIFENVNKDKYLNLYNDIVSGNVSNSIKVENFVGGVYFKQDDYEIDSNVINVYNMLKFTGINSYNSMAGVSYVDNIDSLIDFGAKYNLSFTNEGMKVDNTPGGSTRFDIKKVKVSKLSADGSTNYQFDNIIPKVSLDTTGSTINSLNLKVNATGIYGQFDDDLFSIEIYSDQELTNKLVTKTAKIITDSTGTYSETVTYDNLKPDTTYYVAIYANLDGKYTRLYDSSNTVSYQYKVYEAKTLGAKDILKKIDFSVLPTSYNGEFSNKTISWYLNMNSKENNSKNFKIRFELYDQNDKLVKFDGSSATSCDINANGDSLNGYYNGCYIQIMPDTISDIKNGSSSSSDTFKISGDYSFGGNNFVFGDGYYKLIVYAVPYTNSKYDEDNKLVLYQNDSLSNTGDKILPGGVSYHITIPELELPKFSFDNDTIDVDYTCSDNSNISTCKSYISFKPKVDDKHKVIKYGTYTITLHSDSYSKEITVDANSINNEIKFENLSHNTLFFIEFSYQAYRNNNGLTDNEKVATEPYSYSVYTSGPTVHLGSVSAQKSTDKELILSYFGSSKITDNIGKVIYTIRLNGGGNISGCYKLASWQDNDNSSCEVVSNLFSFSTDRVPKFTINFNSSTFSLNSGYTYNISTQYYYKNSNGEIVKLDNYTTLNL